MLVKLFDIFGILFGLLCIIKFKALGKIAIEQRRGLNKWLPKENFDQPATFLTQIGFLAFGVLIIVVCVSKLLR